MIQTLTHAGSVMKARSLSVLLAIAVARSPLRPRVPTDQRFATGRLASLPDQSGPAAALRTEAFPRPCTHADAAAHRALRPFRPT